MIVLFVWQELAGLFLKINMYLLFQNIRVAIIHPKMDWMIM